MLRLTLKLGTLLIRDIELINFWSVLEIENSYLETTGDRIGCFNVFVYALKRRKMLLYRGSFVESESGAEGAQKKKRTFWWSDIQFAS